MSQELLAILQPIVLALIAASIPGLVGWLAGKRRSEADSSQVVVDAAATATKELLTPLTERVTALEADNGYLRIERADLRRLVETTQTEIGDLQREYAELKVKYDELIVQYEKLVKENAELRNENVTLQALFKKPDNGS